MMIKYAKISDFKIKKIVKHFCVDIEASKTSELTGINRNTVNRFYNIFRHLIFQNQIIEFQKIIGVVELDESYFGAKRIRGWKGKLKRGRGTKKQPVFGIFQRNGRVYTEIVPNCKKVTLQKIIRGRVNLETVIHTDGWRGYDGLVDVGFDKHFRVNHNQSEFLSGERNHINGIENFWSFTKRRLNKFNGTKVNFPLHLKECEWRYNNLVPKMEKELIKLLKNSDSLLKIKDFLV